MATAVAQATVDSADTGPETIFHSFGGRPLAGGDGGIQPDIILPDTLSDLFRLDPHYDYLRGFVKPRVEG